MGKDIKQVITKGSEKSYSLRRNENGIASELKTGKVYDQVRVTAESEDKSRRGESNNLRERLAKEIESIVQDSSVRSKAINAKEISPIDVDRGRADHRLNSLRKIGEGELDALLLRGQRSWNEQKTVIVEIDNSRKGKENIKKLEEVTKSGAENNFEFSDPVEGTTNAINRDKSITLAVGSQLKSNSSAKQPEGGFADDRSSEQKNSSSNRELTATKRNNKSDLGQQQIQSTQGTSNNSLDKKDSNLQRVQTEEPEVDPKSRSSGNNRRLPSFGNIPRKLSRLPYFSYYGKARNVDLITPADQSNKHLEAQVNSDGSGTSLSSSSRSLSSPASTSRIPTITRTSNFYNSNEHAKEIEPENDEEFISSKRKTIGQPARKINWSGYSNISNLFPDRPAIIRGQEYSNRYQRQESLDKDRRKSSSLLDLNNKSDRLSRRENQTSSGIVSSSQALDRSRGTAGANRITGYSSRNRSSSFTPKNNSSQSDLFHNTQQQTMAMRRQNKVGSFNGGIGSNNKQQAGRTGTYKGRPSSVTGYLTKHHRSPSASSLHYNSSGIGLSPYGQSILDPDCPVHGYPSPNGGQVSHSKSTQNIGGADADLLYENLPTYYDTRPTLRNRTASLYSPSSPISPTFGLRSHATSAANNTSNRYGSSNAYYNNSSRFNLYHPSESGRSHLAPTSDQFRRILGYPPPTKPVHLHPQWAFSRPFIHLQSGRSPTPQGDDYDEFAAVRYEPYNQLQDAQAIRAVDFHPSGEVYAVGSNSRALRICAYPADHELRHFGPEHELCSPRVLFKFLQVHRGSIYCVSFNGNGRLLATGSNDQTVHIVRYNPTTHSPDGDEYRLTMHDGTIRDLCFIDDTSNGSSLLLSAGGGDNKVYVTDCETITPFQSMTGHTQMIMSLSHLGGATFVSASYDKTIRFWDLRTRACTSIISAPPNYGTAGNWVGPGAPVCAVKVDPTGRLLASGHSDSTCMLYDVRSARIIQTFRPHEDEIRTLSFSPRSYYLLTGGYDGRVVVSDLQGDLAQPLPSVCVAESDDKIVQAKWHPTDFTFVTTSADRSATLWALPTE